MMYLKKLLSVTLILSVMFSSCKDTSEQKQSFDYVVDSFADLRILRYKLNGFDQLTLGQKKLVYYLSQAGYEGRDIMYDQNYRHNLLIRKSLENIIRQYDGDKSTTDWAHVMTYTKRVWFSNGIHHHYGGTKFEPEFSRDYFEELLNATGTTMPEEVIDIMFDPSVDSKKVNLDPDTDLLLGSATGFYAPDVSQKEAEAFYVKKIDKSNKTPISYGLNSTLVKDEKGNLKEDVWSVKGRYGKAIEKIIFWLEKAVEVAENEAQGNALKLLIEYYKTGDLKIWDDYNIAWSQAVEGDIDYIQGFVEVYNDPLGYRGSFENIVQIKDFEASSRMKVLMDNAQWFEDHSPIMDEHKKDNVVGITYNVVNVAAESGDASPSTPIGVNLPNANWIRVNYGSKSVSLGNIINAYNGASGGSYTEEFAYSDEEKERAKKYGTLSGKMHTAMHEVIGHASGKINDGVGTPKETLKNYASSMEEARADLVSLYYIIDPKLVELGLIPSLDVGKVQYDRYIRNGLMIQLRRIKKGEVIEQAHMRNRQTVSKWVYEKGMEDNVIEKKAKDGKTYFVINDYEKLRKLFGQLLKEVQRIKSEGDYEAAKNLIENYGVRFDTDLHAEVLERDSKLGIAAYSGFVNPTLSPVMDGDEIVDIEVKYDQDFVEQMLYYAETYGNL